jgi:hypothetical protein
VCNRVAATVTVAAALVFASAIVPAATLRISPAPQPAAWIPFDLIVNLQDLPKRYSCDDLWYKFRDVLLAIGARPENIFAYRCEKSLGSGARSPEVHVQFSLPELVRAAERKAADLSVVRKTIELQPGHPPTLDASDCNLLRQVKSALLAALPVQVVSYRLACDAPGRAEPPFEVSVSAWAQAEASKLAAAAPASPASAAAANGLRRSSQPWSPE